MHLFANPISEKIKNKKTFKIIKKEFVFFFLKRKQLKKLTAANATIQNQGMAKYNRTNATCCNIIKSK